MNDKVRMGETTSNDRASEDVVTVINPSGAGRVVLVCEHASNVIPPEFENLGLDDNALQSHIAWDIGALSVAKTMSALLDGPLIAHRISRLVYDCNRSPGAMDAIPDLSEYQSIPGNIGLTPTERLDRTERYYMPFCDTLSACLKQRIDAAQGNVQALPVLITVHSFTPVYKGQSRTVEIGLLHDADHRLADVLLGLAQKDGEKHVLQNSPYGPEDGVTFTLLRHALPHDLLNVMIEIRNDLVGDAAAQKAMAEKLARYVSQALAEVDHKIKVAQVS